MIQTMPVARLMPQGHVPPYRRITTARPAPVSVRQQPRTAAQIAADREAALAEREVLEASRPEAMLNGTPEDVANLDHAIAVAKIRIDQAEQQHARAVTAEVAERAEADAEQARRKALRKQAVKASAEVEKLAAQYVQAAQQLAGVLHQIREREQLIERANASLPDGAEPVPPGEPFNGKAEIAASYDVEVFQHRLGRHETRRFSPGVPGEPHVPLSHRVHLPALGRDAQPIW